MIRTAVFLSLLALPVSASAELVRINLEGTLGAFGSFSDPTGNFSRGETISGFWLVETTTPDSDASASRGKYDQSGTPAFQINIGSSVFQSTATTIQIFDDFALGGGAQVDAYDVLTGLGVKTSNIAGLSLSTMQITMRDNALDAFSSDALPSTAPNLDDFDNIVGQLAGTFNGESLFMNFSVDTVTLAPASPGAHIQVPLFPRWAQLVMTFTLLGIAFGYVKKRPLTGFDEFI